MTFFFLIDLPKKPRPLDDCVPVDFSDFLDPLLDTDAADLFGAGDVDRFCTDRTFFDVFVFLSSLLFSVFFKYMTGLGRLAQCNLSVLGLGLCIAAFVLDTFFFAPDTDRWLLTDPVFVWATLLFAPNTDR